MNSYTPGTPPPSGPQYQGGPQNGAWPQPAAGSPYGAVPQPAAPPMPRPVGLPAQLARPYGHVRRTGYGLLWAFYTAALIIGGFSLLFGGSALSGLLALALGLASAYYDYKIWTWRARRLWFLIIW